MDHFKQADRQFYRLVSNLGPGVWLIKPPAGRAAKREKLYEIVVGQQLSSASARAIWQRLLGLLADDPSVSQPDLWRRAGLSRAKTDCLRRLSQLDFGALDRMEPAAMRRHLLQHKGVGPWTVDMAQIFIYRHLDVFSWSDLALRRAAASFYGLDADRQPDALRRCIDAFRPYRSVAALSLWRYAGG